MYIHTYIHIHTYKYIYMPYSIIRTRLHTDEGIAGVA